MIQSLIALFFFNFFGFFRFSLVFSYLSVRSFRYLLSHFSHYLPVNSIYDEIID